MEASGGVSSGVTVVGSDAPSDYHVAPRTDNPAPASGSTTQIPATAGSALSPSHPPHTAAMEAYPATMPAKKKRGRPRKYAPDGSVTMALSPKPISSSAPLPPVIDFSSEKRGKIKPASSVSKAKFELENLGEWVACSVGANFTPHIITVNSGEDVTMKVISFSQQGPRAICILSANGVISSVTLRQPDSSGGTLTYEGRFEILSLSGSFMPNESGGTRSRSGGMSVSLASPDGRVVGGGVAGLLVAASPVQVVVGSFLAGNQHEQKPRKQKHEVISSVTPAAVVPISTLDPVSILSAASSIRNDNWSAMPAEAKDKPADINVSLPAG
ncbi:hypothetical protein AAZX31_05G051900 [Glycine max]|uniref:AT-hook motif nuclear-localized protein n=3 Tax=Glycine subgen. Soja TaxID=1462606 RepID=I1K0I8_SOYBN|nr:AT-hook motif nuclear-localized protein 1 [Glycine max]XP_028231702.1 AT-hook motif nuclear-localized protein 1-like [Glycine soja]KAG5039724.1 hypothetical protein JHK85_012200 [Glycine max]KAH1132928.1 hypothetical protein GYH30_011662 [Glycine max]KAH1249009.1 AT-hook motif nuclear-localized protein 1 [Glycine max]KRH57315.1 hypothetical protein GLYMA_05G053800v4 [Glycine max]RZC11087.1 AT-hook motif nuclear-localized protein 1 [Glycine soja]|eukprot:XP_003525779.1 AT-hook motif nuclear-localized protein 1 [Glycine max]